VIARDPRERFGFGPLGIANFLDDLFDREAGDHGEADLAAKAGTFGL
jgi:hypothetical protein